MNTPERIAQSIPHTNDPERLREIADVLERWSWYPEAEKARAKARDIERRWAELAAMRAR